MEPLKIAFVTSEVHPFSKTGGLADVSAALPAFLARAGHDVRVVTPLYAKVDRARHPLQAPPPELRDVPAPEIHQPRDPIVDHAEERRVALARYDEVRNG